MQHRVAAAVESKQAGGSLRAEWPCPSGHSAAVSSEPGRVKATTSGRFASITVAGAVQTGTLWACLGDQTDQTWRRKREPEQKWSLIKYKSICSLSWVHATSLARSLPFPLCCSLSRRVHILSLSANSAGLLLGLSSALSSRESLRATRGGLKGEKGGQREAAGEKRPNGVHVNQFGQPPMSGESSPFLFSFSKLLLLSTGHWQLATGHWRLAATLTSRPNRLARL